MSVKLLSGHTSAISTTVQLSNGKQMPIVGLGTFRITGWENIYNIIEAGLAAGYRLIDTAAVYSNEEDIGKALKELLPKFNLKREDIFITTKLSPVDLHRDKVERAVNAACTNLGTYIDLFLIHWPGAAGVAAENRINAFLRGGAWYTLANLHHKGILRAIGVSNYTVYHLKELLHDSYGVIPAVNQVEIHPHYPQPELVEFCRNHNILLQAYCSLGGTEQKCLLYDSSVLNVARNLQKSPAQILLRWALQENLLIIPKSITPRRIKSNSELDFEIPESEMKILNNLTDHRKYAWDPLTIA